MNSHQFAAAMLEEEITGEVFPGVLLQMAKAFSNIDSDDKLCVPPALQERCAAGSTDYGFTAARSTLKSCSSFFASWAPSSQSRTVTCCSSRWTRLIAARRHSQSLQSRFRAWTRQSLEDSLSCSSAFARGCSLASACADPFSFARCSVETLASVTSYELTSSIEELDQLRDLESRPVLERTAAGLLEQKGRLVAEFLDEKEIEERQKQDGILDARDVASPGAFTPAVTLRIFLCCWFCVFRCTAYGLGSGGFNVLFEQASNKYFPISEDSPPAGAFGNYVLWVHYIIQYVPSIIVSFIEALIIYYDLLKTALNIAEIAGLKLYPLDPVRLFVSNSIMAEALELGHPAYVRYGIDPMRGSSRLVLYLCGLLYSARGGLSKFILKVGVLGCVLRLLD